MAEALRFSELLARVVAEHPADRIAFADIVAAIGDRGLGALLLLFALPNLLPLLPGMSLVTALPLILLAAQMVAGRHQPWLPRWIMRLSVEKSRVLRGMPRVLIVMRLVERLIRPRLSVVTGRGATRLMGAMALILSLIAWLPVPGLHYGPALVIAMFGLALINRDGVLALVAALAGTIGVVVLSGLIMAGGNALIHLVQRHVAA